MKLPTLLAALPIAALLASVSVAQGAGSYSGYIQTQVRGEDASHPDQTQQIQNAPQPIADSLIGQDPSAPGAEIPLVSGTYSVNPGKITASVTSSDYNSDPYDDSGALIVAMWTDTLVLSGAPIAPDTEIYIDPIVQVVQPFGPPSLPQSAYGYSEPYADARVTGGGEFIYSYGRNSGYAVQDPSGATRAGSQINVMLQVILPAVTVTDGPKTATTVSESITQTLLGFTVHDSNGNLLPSATFTDSAGTIFPSIHPGDANADGTVDLSDLNIVLNNLGQTTPNWTAGNFDGQPTIDLTDLNDVLNNLGTTYASASTAVSSFNIQNSSFNILPTPEPTSLLLTCLAALPLLTRRRPLF